MDTQDYNELVERYSKQQTSELTAIINDSSSFREEAVAAASEVLRRRAESPNAQKPSTSSAAQTATPLPLKAPPQKSTSAFPSFAQLACGALILAAVVVWKSGGLSHFTQKPEPPPSAGEKEQRQKETISQVNLIFAKKIVKDLFGGGADIVAAKPISPAYAEKENALKGMELRVEWTSKKEPIMSHWVEGKWSFSFSGNGTTLTKWTTIAASEGVLQQFPDTLKQAEIIDETDIEGGVASRYRRPLDDQDTKSKPKTWLVWGSIIVAKLYGEGADVEVGKPTSATYLKREGTAKGIPLRIEWNSKVDPADHQWVEGEVTSSKSADGTDLMTWKAIEACDVLKERFPDMLSVTKLIHETEQPKSGH